MTMLTKVTLEGPLGKAFGRKWELSVGSPSEALRVINANKPGVFHWIRDNLSKYSKYRVVCTYDSGRTEDLDKDTYTMSGKPVSIRFVPVVEGAGGAAKMIVGAVLIAASFIAPFVGLGAASPYLFNVGVGMMIGGAIELLSPRPSKGEGPAVRADKTSYFFDGPANTTMQGVPVQLIYGRVLVGSHGISAAVTVDQLM